MKLSKKSIPTLVNSILLLGIICFISIYLLEDKREQIVYVDNVELFSNFNMAKDLNQQHQNQLQLQKNRVDSLVTLLQNVEQGTDYSADQQRFVAENNKLREMGEYFAGEVSQQVWTRLNSYMEEYGKHHDYQIILGTQGNGNLMFAEDARNITQEFIQFANNKYEGKDNPIAALSE
ncbi:MAG: hypothetical protein KTR22_10340 [Flavobacteriaceae bacterium]|nr:hypothetical protein [Flavobacteriaceae bacterium]